MPQDKTKNSQPSFPANQYFNLQRLKGRNYELDWEQKFHPEGEIYLHYQN